MRRLLALALFVLGGCDGIMDDPPVPPGPLPPRDLTWYVEAVEPLNVPVARWSVSADAGFSLTTARGQLFAGTSSGLHVLDEDGGTRTLSSTAVTGLLTLPSGDPLIARADGLYVVTGNLIRRSGLSDAFPFTPRLLGAEPEGVWLGTATELKKLSGDRLTALPYPNVGSLAVHDGVRVLREMGGSVVALRGAEALALSAEAPIADALPVENGEFLATTTDGGRAVRRVHAEDGGVRWVAAAFAPMTPQAADVQLLGVDRETGAAWLAQGEEIHRLLGRQRATMAWKGGFASALIDANGALVLRQGGDLVRIGDAAPVRFADVVKPLSVAQCETCHRTGGVALPTLETLAQWKAHVDAVLDRIDPATPEGRRMPRGLDALPAAEVDRIRRWKQEGFRP